MTLQFQPRLLLKAGLLLTLSFSTSAQQHQPPIQAKPQALEAETPRTRTVLVLQVSQTGGRLPATDFELTLEAHEGPVNPQQRAVIDREDVPFPMSAGVSLLDREHQVAEIHLYREGTDGTPIPHQIIYLDGSEATHTEIDRGLFWSVRWVEARDER